MMSSQDKQAYDDPLLTRYLLGALPAEEAERLDGLSITDEELAARLKAVENDLVDDYVRGEVTGENLARFKTFYLASAKRRQKVQFAKALRERKSEASAPAPATLKVTGPDSQPGKESPARRMFSVPRLMRQWGFASAAALMLFVAGYLLLQNLQLQKQISEAQARQAALDQREQQMQRELSDQRSANSK